MLRLPEQRVPAGGVLHVRAQRFRVLAAPDEVGCVAFAFLHGMLCTMKATCMVTFHAYIEVSN